MSRSAPLLVPRPRQFTLRTGHLRLRRGPHQFRDAEALRLSPPTIAALRRLLADAPSGGCATPLSIGVDVARFAKLVGRGQTQRRNAIAAAPTVESQGYELHVTRDGICIVAGGPAGVWYAVQTLSQLARGRGHAIPCVEICDWPDFPARGVLLDISRDKVPTMRTLKRLIDLLASWKINQLQLYTEHTFAYRRHRTVWKDASPITPAEARELDAYCRERCIELVPNQNCFGHMERWLKHRRYRPLAETTGPWRDPWGRTRTQPTTLCPGDPRSIRLVGELLAELLPQFTSRMVNVGCDETFELGQGRSAGACSKRGVGRVYLDFVKQIHRLTRKHDRRMQFWADIVHQHPGLIRDLPRDAIALEWGYEADHPFDARCKALAKAGLDFYVCPGTSTWCSFAGRTDNALANLRRAAEAGIKHSAAGYLITDWGDGGHRQYLPASYIPFLYGAGVSWCVKANRRIDAVAAAAALAFDDAGPNAARLWHDLGNVHVLGGIILRNQSCLFRAMQLPFAEVGSLFTLRSPVSHRRLARLKNRLRELRRVASRSMMAGKGVKLVDDEMLVTLDVLDHACSRMMLALHARVDRAAATRMARQMRSIIARHRRLWLRRNRPGGLRDSLAHYERNLAEYETLACKESPRRRT